MRAVIDDIRLDGNTYKEPAAKLIFVQFFFFCAMHSTHHEGKTLDRNLVVLLRNGKKRS